MSFEQLLSAGESQTLEFKTSFDKATIESLGKCRISPATSFPRRPESSVFNPDSSLAPDRATKQHPPLWKRGARGDLNFFRVQKSPSVSFCIPNYTDGSDIQIKIFDDKISIFSPGTFYGGISVADIQADNYRSSLRNKLVAKGFYLTGNIEKYGSGFIRIRKALRDYPEIEFEIKEFAGGVMATFTQRGGVNIQFVQQVVAQLPWGHNVRLLDAISNQSEREWYAKANIEHGWSRNVLAHQIETRAHERQGAAVTNFQQTLPAPQSELAQQLIKDPYVLDFLTLAADAKERDLENGLIAHLQSFLLELGKGFAFIGRQFHLEVGGQDYYLDLLFYNTKLHCHVVIELKIDDFKPEYAGKMQFYLAAVDGQLKSGCDEPSIGLILCKTKYGIIVEYALRDSTKPIGVAEYKVLPPEIADALPTAKQLEAELSEGDGPESSL